MKELLTFGSAGLQGQRLSEVSDLRLVEVMAGLTFIISKIMLHNPWLFAENAMDITCWLGLSCRVLCMKMDFPFHFNEIDVMDNCYKPKKWLLHSFLFSRVRPFTPMKFLRCMLVMLIILQVGVYCSLTQLLDSGFYHADPHPGNLLRTPDGKLAYLGM